MNSFTAMGMVIHGTGCGEKGDQTSEDSLNEERGDENPALLGTEVAVEAGEEQGSEGKEDNGEKTSRPGLPRQVFRLVTDA